MTILERKNQQRTILERKHLKKGNSGKETILERKYLKKGPFGKERIWKRAIRKRPNLKEDNSGKNKFGTGQF